MVPYPKIAYARPSFVISVTDVTVPRATPTVPAKTPCKSRVTIAWRRDVDVPKIVTVTALPNNESVKTIRRPCRSATVAWFGLYER